MSGQRRRYDRSERTPDSRKRPWQHRAPARANPVRAKPEPEQTEIAFTVATGRAPLTKTFGVGPDGKPTKTKDAGLSAGTATRVTLSGTPANLAVQLAGRLKSLEPTQALILAPPPAGKHEWPIVTRADTADRPDAITRTKECFPPVSGPALFGLDFDVAGYPQAVVDKMTAVRAPLADILVSVFPPFSEAACVTRESTSAGIRNREAPTPLKAAREGQHRYYFLKDGADGSDFAKRLFDRLILAGWGWGRVTESGTVLIQTFFDLTASADSSRLWYEAPAVLEDSRLEHVPGRREPRVTGFALLDTRTLAPLTDQEREGLAAITERIVDELAAEAAAKKTAWKAKRRAEMIARGVEGAKADRILHNAVERHALTGDFEIQLDAGGSVTVGGILADPSAFHRKTCADPLEPEYGGGRNKAIIYSDSNPVRIFSHAHGGIEYVVQRDATEFFEPVDEAAPLPGATAAAPDRAEARAIDLEQWCVSRFIGQPPPVEWLVKGSLPRGVPALIAAAGDIGKSYLVLDLGCRIAFGQSGRDSAPIFGGEVAADGTVVILTAEDSQKAIHKRIAGLDPVGARLKAKGRMIVVPLADAGGPLAIVRQRRDGLEVTDDFKRLRDRIERIPDLALVAFDPLQAFVHAPINDSPEAGQFLCTELGSLASATNATVVVTHHMGKVKPIKTRDEARDAIRGTSALVDGMRAVYALWPEAEESRAKAVCRMCGTPHGFRKVVNGAIVKANDEANLHISTYVRNDSGLLVDRSVRIGAAANDETLRSALIDAVAQAAEAGQPFTKTGANGVYHQRSRLLAGLQELSRSKLEALVDSALSSGELVQCAASGSRIVNHLDVPGGPFAEGRGEFKVGAQTAFPSDPGTEAFPRGREG